MTPVDSPVRRGPRGPRRPHLWGAAVLCFVFAVTGIGFGVLGGGAVAQAGREESRALLEMHRRHDDLAEAERSARETGGLLRHVQGAAETLALESARAASADAGAATDFSALGEEGLRLAGDGTSGGDLPGGAGAFALGTGGDTGLARLGGRLRALAPALRAAVGPGSGIEEVRVVFAGSGVVGAPSSRIAPLRADATARVHALRALDEPPSATGWGAPPDEPGTLTFGVPFTSAEGGSGVVTVRVAEDDLRRSLGTGLPETYPAGAILLTDRGNVVATAGDPAQALGCETSADLAGALAPLLGSPSRFVPRPEGHHLSAGGRRLAAVAVPGTQWSAGIVTPMRSEAFDDAPSGAAVAAERFGWAVAGLSLVFGAVLLGTTVVVERAERRRLAPLVRIAASHSHGEISERAETPWEDLAPIAAWMNVAGNRLRQAGVRAEEAERRVTDLVEILGDGLVVTDAEDRIVHANQRFADLLGRTRVSLLGRYVEELLVPGSIARHREESRRRAERQPTRYDVGWHAPKGGPVRTVVAGVPVVDAESRGVGSCLVVTDVTDRTRREEETARAEKLHALGEMAGGVAHDFNNVLTVILGNTQFLLLEDLPEEVAQTLRTIEKSALDGTETVRRIRQFSKVRSAPVAVQPVDPSAVVGEVIDEARKRFLENAKQRGIEVQVEFALNSRRRVMGCPDDLREALGHVVRNALEAMPRGGRLVIETFDRGEDEAGIRVEDNGHGMSPEIERKIFDPFFTTKESGRCAGLGLSIAFGIVRAHRGRIDVRSAPGRGSTFTIVLPAAAASAVAEPAGGESPRRRLPTEVQPRVLLVAGTNAEARALEDGLRKLGLYVAVVAPTAVPTVVADPDLFNVLVVEHDLGGASTGWEISRQSRSQRADLRILLLTAPFHDVSETQARNAGIDRVVQRPFDARDLHGEIFSAMVAPPARLGHGPARGRTATRVRSSVPEARRSQIWSALGTVEDLDDVRPASRGSSTSSPAPLAPSGLSPRGSASPRALSSSPLPPTTPRPSQSSARKPPTTP